MFATVKCSSYFWLLLLLAPSLLNYAYAEQYIGDSCFTPQGPGVCQPSDLCRWAFNGLRSGNRPVECSFVGKTVIVCCPPENPPPPRTTKFWNWEVTTPKIDTRLTDSPSNRMCQEWNNYFFSPQKLIKDSRIRIVNGTAAKALEFPHMAAVGYKSGTSEITWDCGGTLISDKFVLTAAHCLYHHQWGEAAWVRLGYLGPEKSIFKPQFYRIIERIKHPEYNSLMKYNDIALLKLLPEVTFTPFIKPACLDHKDNHAVGEMAVASGWGLTDFVDIDSRSVNLLKVELPIVAHFNCASLFRGASGLPYGIDDRTQMCAGGEGKDTCQGDSGGPLVIKTKALSLHRVVGITSFGESCGSVAPGIYTRVSSYRSWIESIVWPDRSAGKIDTRSIGRNFDFKYSLE